MPSDVSGGKASAQVRQGQQLGTHPPPHPPPPGGTQAGVIARSREKAEVRSQKSEGKRDANASQCAPEEVELFDFWKAASGHDQARFTATRRTKVRQRLKAFSADQLKLVTTTVCADPWYRGENDRGKRYDWIEIILKSDEAVEKHLETAKGLEFRKLEEQRDREQAAKVRRNQEQPRSAEPIYLAETVDYDSMIRQAKQRGLPATVKRYEKLRDAKVQ